MSGYKLLYIIFSRWFDISNNKVWSINFGIFIHYIGSQFYNYPIYFNNYEEVAKQIRNNILLPFINSLAESIFSKIDCLSFSFDSICAHRMVSCDLERNIVPFPQDCNQIWLENKVSKIIYHLFMPKQDFFAIIVVSNLHNFSEFPGTTKPKKQRKT